MSTQLLMGVASQIVSVVPNSTYSSASQSQQRLHNCSWVLHRSQPAAAQPALLLCWQPLHALHAGACPVPAW